MSLKRSRSKEQLHRMIERVSEGGLRHDALMFRPLPSDLERRLFFSSEQIVGCYWFNLPRTGKYDWRFSRKPFEALDGGVLIIIFGVIRHNGMSRPSPPCG